jgi:hypothetical protein
VNLIAEQEPSNHQVFLNTIAAATEGDVPCGGFPNCFLRVRGGTVQSGVWYIPDLGIYQKYYWVAIVSRVNKRKGKDFFGGDRRLMHRHLTLAPHTQRDKPRSPLPCCVVFLHLFFYPGIRIIARYRSLR